MKPSPAGGAAVHPASGCNCVWPPEYLMQGILSCILILVELTAEQADKSAGRKRFACSARSDCTIVPILYILLLLGNIQGYSAVICNPPFWSGEPQLGYFCTKESTG